MPDAKVDVVVVGGGIVGLSTAMHITSPLPQLRVLVLEKEEAVARHQSGHNSGVIHSGIYYKPGSLKAKLCVEGAAAMVKFCREHSLPLRVCGKVIIATSEGESQRLEALLQRGQANGVPGVKLLDQTQLRDIEPHCGGVRGLHVPGTGITDYVRVCLKYAEIITMQGGSVLTGTAVTRIFSRDGEMVIETSAGAFAARYVVNCAGLHSDRVTRMSGQEPDVMIMPFRGEYYELVREREDLVKALIYPVPDPQFPFLGVHFTRRISGGVDAGPNAVLAFKREGYRRTDFSAGDLADTIAYPGFWHMAAKFWRYGAGEYYRSLRKQKFVEALQKLVPEITGSDLVADGSGVRAQAVARDGSLVDDFRFSESARVLHMWNVPSPAATASLPIGRTIAQMARKSLDLV